MPKARNVATYTSDETPMFASTGMSDTGTSGRVSVIYAAIAAAGQTAGQTAPANARITGSSTRRQPAGKITNSEAAVTGTSVPIATPGRPIRCASTTLKPRLTTAVTTLV